MSGVVDAMPLGSCIRRYRKDGLRLSQERFARLLGTSTRTISRWETGVISMETVILSRVERATSSLTLPFRRFLLDSRLISPEELGHPNAGHRDGDLVARSDRQLLAEYPLESEHWLAGV